MSSSITSPGESTLPGPFIILIFDADKSTGDEGRNGLSGGKDRSGNDASSIASSRGRSPSECPTADAQTKGRAGRCVVAVD